jgi:UDP-glucose 4-epimerase
VRTTIKEVAELILEVTGSDLEIQYEPGGMTFVKNRIGSPAKAERDLGFRARTELREGLEKLIEWRESHKAEVEERRRAVGLATV